MRTRLAEIGIQEVTTITYYSDDDGGDWCIICWHNPDDLKQRLEAAGFQSVKVWIDTDDLFRMTWAFFEDDEQPDDERDAGGEGV
jgi:hypothetical protein